MGGVDDDVWDDEECTEYFPNSSDDTFQKDLEKLQEIHSNEGYKAGITAGQSLSTQEGFDKGHRDGADYGIDFGKTLGEIIGIARLELDTELKTEVDNLIKEGWKLSQAAGKGLSKENVEGYQSKCDVFRGKDKELKLERNIMKEDKGKTKNSPWLERTDWKMMFVGQDMRRLIDFTNKDILEPEYILIIKINDKSYLVILAFNGRIGFINTKRAENSRYKFQ